MLIVSNLGEYRARGAKIAFSNPRKSDFKNAKTS